MSFEETQGRRDRSGGARAPSTDGAPREGGPGPYGSWPLDAETCWELLASAPFGRVVFDGPGGPTALPVTHVLDGHALVFRTSPYGVIGRSVGGERVGFQADGAGAATSDVWSVHLHARAELHGGLEDLDLPQAPAPCPDGSRWLYVRLVPVGPGAITGVRLISVAR